MDAAEVYDQALRWLTRRDYGARELVSRLKQNGASHQDAESALARCQELGYQDDARYAAMMVKSRLGRGQGAQRIRQELRAKGVADGVIDLALDEALERPENDPREQALQALIKRFGEASTTDRREIKRRYDFLLRRGFDSETIRSVLGL
ncbi:regulatory protein RecX [Magnetofaba australis]|uniref:Regulatory protein RecX n=1 Tax=Magnetofaba australis IT-1 TaxID=1434232 RepID=A0A1Y2K9L0_9PROT|nr:regulatory protein RecX [Magnetofaba australis]OSM06140.1 putative regulatory protein RecX [Magnetofaba australis IT-1]